MLILYIILIIYLDILNMNLDIYKIQISKFAHNIK